jgi:hypothetical protein
MNMRTTNLILTGISVIRLKRRQTLVTLASAPTCAPSSPRSSCPRRDLFSICIDQGRWLFEENDIARPGTELALGVQQNPQITGLAGRLNRWILEKVGGLCPGIFLLDEKLFHRSREGGC